MFTNTKIALSVAMVLGAASAALAGSENTEDRGGYVISGSTDGVNPVYHPRWFPGYAAHHGNAGDAYAAWPRTQPDDGYGYAAWPQTHSGDAYGYAASPKQTHHRVLQARTRDR